MSAANPFSREVETQLAVCLEYDRRLDACLNSKQRQDELQMDAGKKTYEPCRLSRGWSLFCPSFDNLVNRTVFTIKMLFNNLLPRLRD